MSQAVMGDFPTRQDAERAVLELRTAGVDPADISVILHEQQADPSDPRDDADVASGAFTGAVTGAILGGLLGWILSLGAFDLFGVGRVAADNATGATLLGALLGAILLGLLGGIAGLTFGESHVGSAQHSETAPTDFLVTIRSESV
ncbi:MAG: hypothetical protein M3281_03320, partial [Chloroflexota bacterium]|nr:hypothetical protein [Chloroflexota bacterium]